MIIQALYDYYNILLNDEEIEIPQPGCSVGKVTFYATISRGGELLDLTPLGDDKLDWKEMIVPEQKKRAAGITPYFLCDKSKYMLGCDFKAKKAEISKKHFLALKELHEHILQDVDNVKSKAMLNFLQNWNPDDCLSHKVIQDKLEVLEKSKGGTIVFKLDGEKGYLHKDQAIMKAWKKYNAGTGGDVVGQCLVTGEEDSIERIHPGIKGVRGANKAGATLVGVNAKAFESYQKTQGYNSPIGQSAAFGYTTVLNYLLNNENHRLQIGDASTVFWAEAPGGMCEELIFELIEPKQEVSDEPTYDPETTAYVNGALNSLRQGRPIEEKSDVNFYILGLSPNNARLAVRFWHRDHFGDLVQKIWQHHQDLEIVSKRDKLISISRIVYETIPRNSRNKEASPKLGGALMRSVFTGQAYPQGLFYAIVNRIRSDGEINDIRVAVIKAILKRNARLQGDHEKEGMITVSLNEQNPNVAYRMGRLFAVLEKAQQDGVEGKLNSTIKDRYFGTASAAPRAVFPVLMKLSQHHIAKSDYGVNIEKNIQQIVQGVDEFPAHLNSEEQGMFILGYYHQKEALYQKKQTKEEE